LKGGFARADELRGLKTTTASAAINMNAQNMVFLLFKYEPWRR
jgi:hypothetical protein